MDYQDYLQQESGGRQHFWFQAKNNLIRELLTASYEDKGVDRLILDVGAGTGAELGILSAFGRVIALDKNDQALELAAKTGCDIIKGDVQKIEWPKERYDCVCCFDVLEHIADDQGLLDNIFRSLKKSGRLIFTVPAHPFLYGPHDLALEHMRRYAKKDIFYKLKKSGFFIIRSGYWNSWLFLPEALFRIIKKILFNPAKTKKCSPETRPLPGFINTFLFHVLNTENRLVRKKLSFFPGLTIYGIARK